MPGRWLKRAHEHPLLDDDDEQWFFNSSCLTNESVVFFTVRGRLSCMFVLFGDDYVMLGGTAVYIPLCRCRGSVSYNPCLRQYCVPLAIGRTADEIGLG